jgi:hypothetical protein
MSAEFHYLFVNYCAKDELVVHPPAERLREDGGGLAFHVRLHL